MRPKLQVALDLTSLDAAVAFLENKSAVAKLDIIEVGTVLLASEGKAAIQKVKSMHPDKPVVADLKIADAAQTITTMFFESGADFATVIASADIQSMKNAHQVAVQMNKTIQIELYGAWDFEMARHWRETGIEHIIYHHSRDAGKIWDHEDIQKIQGLIDLGYQVNVTGGITTDTIALFKGLPVYSLIIGRTIYWADDVDKALDELIAALDQNF